MRQHKFGHKVFTIPKPKPVSLPEPELLYALYVNVNYSVIKYRTLGPIIVDMEMKALSQSEPKWVRQSTDAYPRDKALKLFGEQVCTEPRKYRLFWVNRKADKAQGIARFRGAHYNSIKESPDTLQSIYRWEQ